MALLTLGEQLEEIQTAISKVLNSQEYTLSDGRKQRHSDLEWLHKRELDLIKAIEDKGADYIVGSNTMPSARTVPVSFV